MVQIETTTKRSNWPLGRVLKVLGLKGATYFSWKKNLKTGRLEDKRPVRVQLDKLLPEEEQAIKEYALSHPKDGYRRLAYMMMDEDKAYCCPSSVYRVLSENDLLCRWKPSSLEGVPMEKPTQPNQRWHTDIMYLWVEGRWYFFVGVLDGYARYIVHWELLTSMRSDDVSLVVHRALEKVPGCRPEIISDNGAQFTSKEFRNLIKRFQLHHITIRMQHPESNGVIERLHRNLREGISEKELKNLGRAREIIAGWVYHYNNVRLHAGIDYLRPKDYYAGNPEQLLQERKDKLEKAREKRRIVNSERYWETSPGANYTKTNQAKTLIYA